MAKARTCFAEGFKIMWLNTKGLGKRIKVANRAALDAFKAPVPEQPIPNKDEESK